MFRVLASGSGGGDSGRKTDEISDPTKNRVIASPLFYYTPETNLAIGVVGSFLFRDPNARSSTPPSVVSPIFIYTLNKQFRAQVTGDIYLNREGFILRSEAKMEKYPDKFFGIGNDTMDENRESFTSKSFSMSFSLLKKLGRSLKVGLQYSFSHSDVGGWETSRQLAVKPILGSRGGLIAGPSFLLDLDTRDNVFYPSRGEFFEMSYSFLDRSVGSDFDFSLLRLNLRKYLPLFSSHVLAFQSLIQLESGEVPFYCLSQLGGQNILRGYYQGRFRDKNLAVLQAEYRLPILWKLGGVAFANVGQVADRLGHFAFGSLRYTLGAGLRYLFDKKEKIQIRADIGFSRDSTGFYFSIFEAF